MKYLYGASVQGIQEFIFATNKLQEIVGASEIVKNIAKDFTKNYNPDEILVNAAGNIKAVFYDKQECEKVVREFSKLIQQKAYGITLSQAVVAFEDEAENHINELEKRLKIQRNKVQIPLDMSINILKLNSKTAKPSINREYDISTQQKINAYPKDEKFKELSKLSNSKNKIAVIHADGNGLGQLIPKLKDELNLSLSEFSKRLDLATKAAFDAAKTDKMKVREVILGGDDLAVICDADDALEFTKNFLYHFEKETVERFSYKLTACAGIAYTNEKYPFHYAISLAETLCAQTKKHAKELVKDTNKTDKLASPAPSSLMFHNIQSSNFQSWDKFLEDELTIINEKQQINLDFGPYYLDAENQPKIENLINTMKAYSCEGSPLSKLRSWLSELYKSDKYATDMLERINEMAKQSKDWDSSVMDKNLQNLDKELSNQKLIIDKDGKSKTPIYDILQIKSATEVTS